MEGGRGGGGRCAHVTLRPGKNIYLPCCTLFCVATLLMPCGTEIIKGVLGSRAINNRVEELSILCCYLTKACISADSQRSWCSPTESRSNVNLLITILRCTIDLLPTPKDRKRLLTSIMETWKEYLAALYEYPEDDSGQFS